MRDRTKRPPQLDRLFPKIHDCLEQGFYRQSKHAIERKLEREIDLLDVLYVLKNGYHEKQKPPLMKSIRLGNMQSEVKR